MFWSGAPTVNGRGGAALVGVADALARPRSESLVANKRVANKPTVLNTHYIWCTYTRYSVVQYGL